MNQLNKTIALFAALFLMQTTMLGQNQSDTVKVFNPQTHTIVGKDTIAWTNILSMDYDTVYTKSYDNNNRFRLETTITKRLDYIKDGRVLSKVHITFGYLPQPGFDRNNIVKTMPRIYKK
jgi:plastocyanin